MAETFGERLRRLREASNLSPGELSHRVGVTENAIRQMELGYTKSASLTIGIRLADALGISAHYLATGRDRQSTAVLEYDGRKIALDLRFLDETGGEDVAATLQAAVTNALARSGVDVIWEGGFARATPPVSSVEGEQRLPEDLGRVILEMREQMRELRDATEKAQATADEAKSLASRRGRQSA